MATGSAARGERKSLSTETTRAIPLENVRADGWFERLAEESPSFERLCEVVGERFVAFSVIAGVRITALTVDRKEAAASLVDFFIGEDTTEQRLPLSEFRRRLALALLSDDASEDDAAALADGSPEELQQYIGFRYVLLAPLFGVELRELLLSDEGEPEIRVGLGDSEEVLRLDTFREALKERIRDEITEGSAAAPFAIDLALIPQAEEAMASEDYERTVELLGGWPGPLSILLRTPEGSQLTADVRATLARALGLLGTAYSRTDRHDWAEEVMRLGIQWGQDGPAAGDLFRRLGEACVERDRHGEAIGLLRRAIGLGASLREVLPTLAQCYAEREQWVAAMMCAEEARALGVESETVSIVLERGSEALGEAWTSFRSVIPCPTTHQSETIPAPSPGGST